MQNRFLEKKESKLNQVMAISFLLFLFYTTIVNNLLIFRLSENKLYFTFFTILFFIYFINYKKVKTTRLKKELVIISTLLISCLIINISMSNYIDFSIRYFVSLALLILIFMLLSILEIDLLRFLTKYSLLLLLLLSFTVWWQYIDSRSFFSSISWVNYDVYTIILNEYLQGKYLGVGNYAGIFSSIIIFFSFFTIQRMNNFFSKVLVLMSTVFTIFLIGNRGTLLAFVITILLYYIGKIIFSFVVKKERMKRNTIYLTLIVVIAGFLLTVFLGMNDKVSSYFSNLRLFNTSNEIGTISLRIYHYEEALLLLKENWFLGSGLNSYLPHSIAVGGIGPLNEVTYVHNIYLQILAECGLILGVIICLIIFKYTFKNFILSLKHSDFRFLPALFFVILGLSANPIFGAQLILFIFSLFSYKFYRNNNPINPELVKEKRLYET